MVIFLLKYELHIWLKTKFVFYHSIPTKHINYYTLEIFLLYISTISRNKFTFNIVSQTASIKQIPSDFLSLFCSFWNFIEFYMDSSYYKKDTCHQKRGGPTYTVSRNQLQKGNPCKNHLATLEKLISGFLCLIKSVSNWKTSIMFT